ncbi:alcohol dehydrogenase catalytic domain-containing protein [uncultured Sphingomonas sp.]|uniref:alcohol dehydrogenase catalytic domain-containing protein n=1 Tax=uncultured Sphingomonas sp. TaxID=158754 RepID=UPI0035CBA991
MTPERGLELRNVPEPQNPPSGHLTVRILAAAINSGDKSFLKRPAGGALSLGDIAFDIWGASAAGEVVASGPDVTEGYVGRKVAIYRSLGRGPDTIGLWCETAQVPFTSCLRLPDDVDPADYSGSLVNLITAYAFLEDVSARGDSAVLATAGSSATGRALAVLARARGIRALLLVRSMQAKAELEQHGITDVYLVDGEDGLEAASRAAEACGASTVFDGVGGAALGRLLPHLPLGSTVYAYGFLGGPEPVSFPSSLLNGRNLTLRPFSNFGSATVRDRDRLAAAFLALEHLGDHPLLRTRVGSRFRIEQIEAAMAFSGIAGSKAIIEPSLSGSKRRAGACNRDRSDGRLPTAGLQGLKPLR